MDNDKLTPHIRTATHRDRDDINGIYSSAFPEGEGELVAKLAIDLLSESSTPETISLMAETGDSVVGHIAFSPVATDGHKDHRAYILAPLAVRPTHQQRGIGSALIEHGMRQLSALQAHTVFVYGDPDYYGRFGFDMEAARNYSAPYPLQYPFGWQAIVLSEYAVEKTPTAIRCVAALYDPTLW